MKNLLKSISVVVCMLLIVSLASCGKTDEKIDEATFPLNEKIVSLNGQITELEGQLDALESENKALETDAETLEAEKAALEAEKAALEAEKATLEAEKATLEAEKVALETEKAALEIELAAKELEVNCAKGDHVWDGESEVSYYLANDYSYCEASLHCKNCNEDVTVKTEDVTADESLGGYIVDFGDNVPSTTVLVPIFTGASFNSDSAGYDEATNIFTVSDSNLLLLSFSGVNLDMLSEERNYMLGVLANNRWYALDKIFNSQYGISTITETKVTVTFGRYFTQQVLFTYGEVTGFALFDAGTLELVVDTMITITPKAEPLAPEPDEYTLVSNAEELSAAVKAGGKIKFATDIVSETGFDLWRGVTIDLAGYDLTITDKTQASFWNFSNSEILDSVGGSTINASISLNSGVLKISGAVEIDSGHTDILVIGLLDLSDYIGGELMLDVTSSDEGVILLLPDGYALYGMDGELVSEEKLKEAGVVYVRPVQQ